MEINKNIKIYNTLTRKVELLEPVNNDEVRMYVCGPTVYNYFHIGNARAFIVFDTFRNFLKYSGYKVIYVQNITDIDDKIINKAKEENTTWDNISRKYTEAFFEDIKKLNIEPADIFPKATQEISEMIHLIEELYNKGIAYKTENGIYFDVTKFKEYGKLSHKNIDELQSGIRVEVDEKKKNPLDFALWKFSKPDEPSWVSPWGAGRPGWHIECSAMSSKYLGGTFDIHAGGIDLIFPHHENEIAQYEAARNQQFVKYWMHNGFMNIKGEKMSKSIGNIVLTRDIVKEYSAEVLRFFILSTHYRAPMDFSKENLESSKAGYREIYYTFQRIYQLLDGKEEKKMDLKIDKQIYDFKMQFIDSLNDDFNTPKAIGIIFSVLNAIKTDVNKNNVDRCKLWQKLLYEMCSVLKIKPEISDIKKEIKELVDVINNLRKEKKYNESDALRKKLLDDGYALEFTKERTFVIKEMK
ncbi:MAG: cysteine--tRNA ligase [Candidatus Goldbacteria bacterium]|nr:cysteine--tRNA ligase [Candidatus Goldiibacteriota bacterium]